MCDREREIEMGPEGGTCLIVVAVGPCALCILKLPPPHRAAALQN